MVRFFQLSGLERQHVVLEAALNCCPCLFPSISSAPLGLQGVSLYAKGSVSFVGINANAWLVWEVWSLQETWTVDMIQSQGFIVVFVYFGGQILVLQVMFPYLEAWHSWGAWGARWAQSWALQGTETLWFNRHTAHPGRLLSSIR